MSIQPESENFIRFVQAAKEDATLQSLLAYLGRTEPAARAELLARKAAEMRGAGVPEDVIAVLGLLKDPALWARLERFMAEERAKGLAEPAEPAPRWPVVVIAVSFVLGLLAAAYFGSFNRPSAARSLIKIARGAPRTAALCGDTPLEAVLGSIGDEAPLERLGGQLRNNIRVGRTPCVRLISLEALVRLPLGATEDRKRTGGVLVEALADDDPAVGDTAAEAIAKLDYPGVDPKDRAKLQKMMAERKRLGELMRWNHSFLRGQAATIDPLLMNKPK